MQAVDRTLPMALAALAILPSSLPSTTSVWPSAAQMLPMLPATALLTVLYVARYVAAVWSLQIDVISEKVGELSMST